MVNMENNVALPLKCLFYSRYVDDIYNRRRKDEFDEIFHALNNYHENINLTIEIRPSKFLDTQLINIEGKYIAKRFTERKAKYLYTGHQKYQSNIRETPLQQIYTEQKI